MSMSWATMMGAVRYGYTPMYVAQIEGISTLFLEHLGDAGAPTYYTIEAGDTSGAARNAGLIIDRAPRTGSVLDEKNHLSKAFDQELRFFDTAITRAIFGTRPTLVTELTSDLTAAATTIDVKTTSGWTTGGLPKLYIGTSTEVPGGALWTSWTSVTRGRYGRARSYKQGTLVANAPYVWRGRRVRVYAVLLDPMGRYVQTTDILSQACQIWEGTVQERPTREGNEWVLVCRDQVNRLRQPLGVAASGQAIWTLDDDALRAVPTQMTIMVRLANETVELDNVQVRPFLGQSSPLRVSQMRQLIVDALDAAFTAAGAGTPVWKPRIEDDGGGMRRRWYLFLPYTLQVGDDWLKTYCKVDGGSNASLVTPSGGSYTYNPPSSGTVDLPIPLYMKTQVTGASVAVTLEGVESTDIPSSGWILLEGDGNAQYRRYLSFTVDPVDSRKVHLQIDETSDFTGEDVAALARQDMEGTLAQVGAKFFWVDSGAMPDIMRRAIVSTGDAQHGAYDTLPKGQGLGLPNIDADSFDEVFDEFFGDFSPVIAAEAGTSFDKLFGGYLRLAQRGIAARRASDGSAVNIAAVHVGSSAAGVPVATITDTLLVSSQGRRPVRVRETFAGPQAIEVTCRVVPIGDKDAAEGTITLKDPHLVDWTGERWEIDLTGVTRDGIRDAATWWAYGWFRGGENRQILEFDAPPWVDAQPGDIVEIDVTDPHLWDYSTGAPGMSGLGRVLGCQFSMVDGVQTITVAVDGVLSAGPYSPSLIIAAVNGSPWSPTSIDFDDELYDLLVRWQDGEASWRLLAYMPGQDAGRGEYVLGAITRPTGLSVARVAVTTPPSSPTVALTTAHRMTFPVASLCTAKQAPHLHNTDRVQWS